MIDAITLETAHLLGDALPQSHRLRYRIFVERQQYHVPTLRHMEWDQFDTPAAVYLLWRDEHARVRAIARLIPTHMPYMIRELWPELVSSAELPCRSDTWEVTRLGIDRDLDRTTRERVMGEMMCALGEFGLRYGIRQFLFVTAIHIIETAVRRAGVKIEILGKPHKLGTIPVVAARLDVNHEGMLKVRRYHKVASPVLRVVGENGAQAA